MTCAKHPYATRKQALTAAHRPYPHSIPLRAYKCPHCHFWHLAPKQEAA